MQKLAKEYVKTANKYGHKQFKNDAAKEHVHGVYVSVTNALERMKAAKVLESVNYDKLRKISEVMNVNSETIRKSMIDSVYKGVTYSTHGKTPYVDMKLEEATSPKKVDNYLFGKTAKDFKEYHDQAVTMSYMDNRNRGYSYNY
jgi:predicted nucleotidyltransferase